MMNKLIYSIAFILLALNLKSQDFKKDILMVYDEQKKAEKMCFNITYTLHENHNANSRVISKSAGKYFKIKNTFLSSLDHIVSVTMPDKIIMIDKEKKKIVVKKQQQKETQQMDILAQLELYNKYIKKTVPMETKDGYTYIVELNTTSPYPISKYEITINHKLKAVTKISLFYKGALEKDEDYKIEGTEVPRLDVEFTDYNKFDLFKQTEITAEYYYTKNNNKITPTNNFKGYAISQI